MNLAPRKGFIEYIGTSSNVGPNTYNVTYPTCDYRKENYAPFLTTAPRTKQLKATVDVTYDIPQNRSKIKYGNSLQFTAPRKTIAIDSNLEPNELAGLKEQHVKVQPSRKSVGGGKLYLCHMPLCSGVSAPSIPTHIDENGYLVTEDNDLIKRPCDEHDNTLGPAYYDVPMGELCYNTFKYKGWTWSKMMAKRSQIVTGLGPGPAAYHPKLSKCVRVKTDESKIELTRKCCEVPRFTCEKICQAKVENLPGPGYYEIVDIDKMGKLQNLSLGPRPFINAAKRFTYKISKSPGPQDYLVCDCYKHRRDFSFKDVGFCTEASRSKKQQIHYDAGPASYSQTEPNYHRYTEKLMRAPFWTTQERTLLPVTNALNPGPGEYNLMCWDVKCCPYEPKQKTSVFTSNVCRFKNKYKDGPDPATYSIVPARKQSHAKINVPFNTSEKKFSKSYDFAGRIAGAGSPGVGEYNLAVEASPCSLGRHFNTSPRFKRKSLTKIPGPGHYTFHPAVSQAMYKARTTHNARLMKNVVDNLRVNAGKKKLGTQTPAPEAKIPDRKVLRWFKSGTGVFKYAF